MYKQFKVYFKLIWATFLFNLRFILALLFEQFSVFFSSAMSIYKTFTCHYFFPYFGMFLRFLESTIDHNLVQRLMCPLILMQLNDPNKIGK